VAAPCKRSRAGWSQHRRPFNPLKRSTRPRNSWHPGAPAMEIRKVCAIVQSTHALSGIAIPVFPSTNHVTGFSIRLVSTRQGQCAPRVAISSRVIGMTWNHHRTRIDQESKASLFVDRENLQSESVGSLALVLTRIILPFTPTRTSATRAATVLPIIGAFCVRKWMSR
jgi:hypothetical protein